MGQSISYPPLDVVIYLTKFLWFDDIHSFTRTSHTINEMLESESDLWRTLLHSSLQRVLSIPFCLHLERSDPALTKMLIRRTCDHPCGIDELILRNYKGPEHVLVIKNTQEVKFQQPPGDSYHADEPAAVSRRTVVSNNHFPCLAKSSKCPRALVPFTNVRAVGAARSQQNRASRNNVPIHTASLSSVAYFEGTIIHQSDTSTAQRGTIQCRIGIACAPSTIRSKLPGEDSFSFGYVSTSGQIVQNSEIQSGPGEPYSEGDTVGCGLIYPLIEGMPGHIFFTKNGLLQRKIMLYDAKVFFSIAWFPVMGVATAGHSTLSLNFGITNPFLFDVNAFEIDHFARDPDLAVNQKQWPTLSAYYMHHICIIQSGRGQRLKTQYISDVRYIKKDTYSLFTDSKLTHETLVITDPKTYKHQGVILSDDSSDDEGD